MKNKKYLILVKQLKNDNQYKEYKKYFYHPSTRFILLYIVSFFEDDEYTENEIKKLINLEFEFIKNRTKISFSNIFSNITEFLPKKYSTVDWKSLGNYFFYVWQTSLFYYDKKHNNQNKNTYIELNHIKLNSEKRDYYYKWIDSIKKCDVHFNIFILYLKRKGI